MRITQVNLTGWTSVLRQTSQGVCKRVPTYRLYRLDGAGNIATADWIEAEGDEDALRQARERNQTPRFELWERGRLVIDRTGN